MSEFSWPLRVYYEDTDAGTVVYYANYLRFMERARTEYLRSFGIGQEALRREQGVVFAVRSAQVEFLKPARLDDELEVTVRLTQCRRASVLFDQAVYRAGQSDQALCTAQVRVACLAAEDLRPHPIPTAVMQVLDPR